MRHVCGRLPVFLCVLAFSSINAFAQVTRVSVASDGTEANGPSALSAFSADGRYVVFASTATNLVTGDTNASADVFVKDRQNGAITRVSVDSTGAEHTGTSGVAGVDISDDGNLIVFESEAALVGAGNPNTCPGVSGTTVPCADIYLHDRTSGQTTRITVPGNGHSTQPRISANGRWIAFNSLATNLVAADTNGASDIFLYDRTTTALTRVSVSTTGAQGDGDSSSPEISDDGEVIAFVSRAKNLTPDPAVGGCGSDVVQCGFFHVRATGTTTLVPMTTFFGIRDDVPSIVVSGDGRYLAGIVNVHAPKFLYKTAAVVLYDRTSAHESNPLSAPVITGISINRDGRYVAAGGGFIPPSQTPDPSIRVYDRLTRYTSVGMTSAAWPAIRPVLSADGNLLLFDSYASDLVTGDSNGVFDVFVLDADTDHDGIRDTFEELFGLDPTSPGDAALDPDNDGATSLQEYQRGTHPNGVFTRYFAEGAQNEFFDTFISLLNPGTTRARILMRYLRSDGSEVRTAASLEAQRSMFIYPYGNNAWLGDFSTVIESDQPVVADRLMYFGDSLDGLARGSHLETAIAAPSTEWYLAEGATHGAFDLFYLLQNPGDTEAQATVDYLRPAGAPVVTKMYTVPPHSRHTTWVDREAPELEATDVSAKITSTQPIIVERAMYMSRPGYPFLAGHDGAGVTTPATRWFLAEGATGSFFDEYVLVANPGAQDATLTFTYLLPDGAPFTKSYVAAAHSRLTVGVDGEDARLADTPVSIIVDSTNGQPVIVERAMWWPSPNWYEAHLSMGATTTGTKWAIANGASAAAEETYLLIANTSNQDGSATITLYFPYIDYPPASMTVPLKANSRVNVAIGAMFPGAFNSSFGAVVESDGVQIVVEQAHYRTFGATTWTAGAAALATKLQ